VADAVAEKSTTSQASDPAVKLDNGLGLSGYLKSFMDGEKKSDDPATEPAKQTNEPEPKAEEKPEETKAKPEAKAEPKAAESEKPKDDADDKIQKQLRDTKKWANDINMQHVETQRKLDATLRELDTVKKKLDGTYEEPKRESADEVIERERLNIKVAASIEAAKEMFGEETVQNFIFAEDAPFKELEKDPAIRARVYTKALPVVEAIRVVKEHEAKKKYGDTPEAMAKAIEKELTEKLTKEITEKVKAEFTTKQRKPMDTVRGLSDVRGVSTPEAKASDDQPADERWAYSMFPNFAAK